jgi:hypothetical protein
MNMNTELKFSGNDEQMKFVIIRLSTGEILFATAPLRTEGGGEIRHKAIVASFCTENGYNATSWLEDSDAIDSAQNAQGVTMDIRGGGLIEVKSGRHTVISGVASSDYGKPWPVDVRPRIIEAARAAGMIGWEIILDEMRRMREFEQFTIE